MKVLPIIIGIIGILVAIGVMTFVARANVVRETAKCEAKGGALIMSASRYVCLRAEVIK